MKNKNIPLHNNQGYALISLIVITFISLTISSAAVIVNTLNISSSSYVQLGTQVLSIAESGGENAVLRLLRDPTYNGEELSINDGMASITVTGDDVKTITSQGSKNGFERTVQIVLEYNEGQLVITSWREVTP